VAHSRFIDPIEPMTLGDADPTQIFVFWPRSYRSLPGSER
jgi:hypothetical protein